MPRWVAIRILSVIPTIIGVAILVFLLVRFIPGTVVEQILGAQFDISQGQIDALRAYFGLDQPPTSNSGPGRAESCGGTWVSPGAWACRYARSSGRACRSRSSLPR